MASLTQITAYRVTGGFECSGTDAIMTTGRGTCLPRYGTVIKCRAGPTRSGMTHITGGICGHMGGSLTSGNGIVMTHLARSRGFRMGKRQNQIGPRSTDMTGGTVFTGGWMAW